jgi:hypothetical protein
MTQVVTKNTVVLKDNAPVLIGILRYIYNTISCFTRFHSYSASLNLSADNC